MDKFDLYNRGLLARINPRLRKWVMAKKRRALTNKSFSLLCNNCNGGILSHDLGLQFRSPTVNLFFYSDHFLRFCENLDHYLAQPLTLCREPRRKPDTDYPVCNLGDLELHFLHYRSFEEAKEKWDARTARLDRENLFIMWTFFDPADEATLARFERLPFPNKVAFTEREFPQYPSAYCIRGYEKGLGVLSVYEGLGRRKIDQFDYVSWFNR